MALHHPRSAERVLEAMRPDQVEDDVLRRILQYAVRGPVGAPGPAPIAMQEPEVQRVLTELLATDLGEYDSEEAIDRTLSDCLMRIKARSDRRAGEELQRKLAEAERAGDHKTVERIQAQFLALKKDRARNAV